MPLSFVAADPFEFGYTSSCGGPPASAAMLYVPLNERWPRLRVTIEDQVAKAYIRTTPSVEDYWERTTLPDYLAKDAAKLLRDSERRLRTGVGLASGRAGFDLHVDGETNQWEATCCVWNNRDKKWVRHSQTGFGKSRESAMMLGYSALLEMAREVKFGVCWPDDVDPSVRQMLADAESRLKDGKTD